MRGEGMDGTRATRLCFLPQLADTRMQAATASTAVPLTLFCPIPSTILPALDLKTQICAPGSKTKSKFTFRTPFSVPDDLEVGSYEFFS